MEYFPYGEKELSYLRGQDRMLGEAIDRIGFIRRELRPDLFSALVHTIIGQQISSAAQETVWNRILRMTGEEEILLPSRLLSFSQAELCRAGISGRKAGYILTAAQKAVSGELNLQSLAGLSDEAFCNRMTALPGVGQWTAEMLLIFSLARPNVVSFGDFGIRKGMQRLYGCENVSRDQFFRYRQRYTPYGTVASFYLWAVASGQ